MNSQTSDHSSNETADKSLAESQELAQEYCFNILCYLFDERQEDPSVQRSVANIAEALNYDESSTGIIVEDLMDSDLIESVDSNAEVSLTSLGLDVVSRYRKNFNLASTPTTTAEIDVREQSLSASLPDVVDILLPETHGVVKVTFPAVADALRESSASLGLSADQQAELEADIHTVEIQLASPKPKTQVLVQCYRAIELVLEEANSGAEEGNNIEELIRSVKSLMA
jgi:predicted transcriptional regulator